LLDRAPAARPRPRVHAEPVLRSFNGKKEKTVVDLVRELWSFMRVRKKFWMLPILVMMMLFGGLIVLTQGSAIAPFMYTIF
ncbi:MAG: DUF5989 family protein, partial [Rhodospirillales bacterium]|nr:DUF5989 family protein [Rhodospirillales bacterium]